MKSYFLNKIAKGSKGLLCILKGSDDDLWVTFQSNGANIQVFRKENGLFRCCYFHICHCLRKGNPLNEGC